MTSCDSVMYPTSSKQTDNVLNPVRVLSGAQQGESQHIGRKQQWGHHSGRQQQPGPCECKLPSVPVCVCW